MKFKNTCNQKQMRTMNSTAVLCALVNQGPTSRCSLSNKLNLDGTTITHLVRGLLKKKLIETSGFSTTTGRPRELLRLNVNAREAIGLLLDPNHIVGKVVNLGGEIKFRESVQISYSDSRETLLSKIRMICDQLLQKTYKSRLLGIGLAYHGIVNKNDVLEQSAGLSALEGINLRHFFENLYNMPFALQDTSRCLAIAEHWFGSAKDIEDFILIQLDYGIGCTLVVDSKPLCGVANSAGEIGHTMVVPEGRICRCGMRGCLETIASLSSIEDLFNKKHPELGKVTYEHIAKLVAGGHEGAIEIITEAGKYIGIALSNLISVLNPGHLVLCGRLFSMGPILKEAIKSSLKSHTVFSSYNSLRIIDGQLEPDSAAIGAAMLILEKTFCNLA